MKPTTAELTSLLASRQYVMAKLFTFTLIDGTVLRYTSGDQNITSGSTLYSAGGETGPYFEKEGNRANGHWSVGLGADTLNIDVLPGSSTVNSVAFTTAARAGHFDGAAFQMDYAFMPVYGTIQNGCQIVIFKGRVAEVAADRNIVSFKINDYRELLNQSMPREVFAATCANTLYDASCTVNPNSFSNATAAQNGGTQDTILCALPQATGYYDLGKITFTSGANTGFSYGVSSWTQGSPGILRLVGPVPLTIVTGDVFTAFAGCDRTTGSGGCTKFANIDNFRGFPYVPPPETAV